MIRLTNIACQTVSLLALWILSSSSVFGFAVPYGYRPHSSRGALKSPRLVTDVGKVLPYVFSTPALAAMPRAVSYTQRAVGSVVATICKPFIKGIQYAQRALLRATVASMSGFLTALLIDPGVNHAAANAIKDGMNLWFTQPNAKAKILKLQNNLQETSPSIAKAAGEEFPKVILNFISGLILQDFNSTEIDASVVGRS